MCSYIITSKGTKFTIDGDTIEDVSSIVYHLFGEDILDKIISPNVDEELIEKVDATIQELEKLIEKDSNMIDSSF